MTCLETAKCLLLRGAEIDTQDDYNNTPLHRASNLGNTDLVQLLLQCGANQEMRNVKGTTAQDFSQNEETRAVFGRYKENKNKDELLQQAIEENNYDVAIILIFRGAKLEGLDNFEKLIQISRKTQLLDEEHLGVLVSRGSDLSRTSYRKLMEMFNVSLIRENIENHFIQNIEVREESGDTPLHAAAASDNDKVLKFLLNNGASTTQFLKNKNGQIPLEISKRNKYMFRIILIDFLNYALKSPDFSSDEFQNQLGSGADLFCLKRDFDGNKTLLEFLNDQGLVKEREELVQLLIKIDRFRYTNSEEKMESERRIIKILRAGMKPSKGLKESIESVQEKYPWKYGKIAVKSGASVLMCLLGCSLYVSDIASDFHFYSSLDQNDEAARITTIIHIILPFVFSFLVFLSLLSSKIFNSDCYFFFKIPLPPFAKINKSIIECRSFINNNRKEEADYDRSNTIFMQQLEDQKNFTTISMIIEASMESSFQFLFQGLFSLPSLVFSFLDIHEGTLQMKDLVNWKHLSIVLSFLSFAFTSFNIR